MLNISIRNAQVSDAGEISILICQNAEKLLKPHYTKSQWNVFLKYYSVEAIQEKIVTQKMFCAIQDGVIVGTIALDNNFVVGFYTELEKINQGIGKALMTYLENYAKNIELKKIQLAASPEGLSFYYKTGWSKVKDFVIEHYGVGFEETLMEKIVGQ